MSEKSWGAGGDSVYFNTDEPDRISIVMDSTSAGETQLVYTKSPRQLAAALLAAADVGGIWR